MHDADIAFTGSILELYDTHLGPLLFAPYARELAARLVRLQPATVLEVAAGTGVVTREIARATRGEDRRLGSQPGDDRARA